MRFSLRQLLSAFAAFGVLLAVLCWHPILGAALLLLCGLPLAAALLKARPRVIVFAAVPAMMWILFLWVESFDLSLSGGWGPTATYYQATMQRGKVLFFRFHYARESGEWLPSVDGHPEPKSDHWSRWPGFHEERYWIRVPGVEVAESEFLAPMIARSRVDRVQVLTLSFWSIFAAVAVFVGALAGRAARNGKQRQKPVNDSPLAASLAAPADSR